MTSLLNRLSDIDRRFFYIILALAIFIPVISPMGLPINVTEATEQAYMEIQNVKPGERVLFLFDYSVSGAPDVDPGAQIVFELLMEKGARVVCVAFIDQGPMFIQETLRKWETQGKIYGEDFVNLGYVAGMETAMAAFARDLRSVVSKDSTGIRFDSLPIMEGVKSASDFRFAVKVSTGVPGVEEWVRQFYTEFGTRSVHVYYSNGAPRCYPYLQSDQIHGLLGGLRGSAELEKLAEKPGPALAGMDAQSLGHYTISALILLGNIGYFTARGRTRGNFSKKGSEA